MAIPVRLPGRSNRFHRRAGPSPASGDQLGRPPVRAARTAPERLAGAVRAATIVAGEVNFRAETNQARCLFHMLRTFAGQYLWIVARPHVWQGDCLLWRSCNSYIAPSAGGDDSRSLTARRATPWRSRAAA